ncbi:MAG: hypothetical protein A2X49_14765 [Lentisphaerae bacterium GWF2_52_8]|nr:MAG: hypothetical protein A2X49_14765 [Lentisphaerae bacterium GWF2_52_8]
MLLTNKKKLLCFTISEIYTDCWKTEIFFKTIKQNLKIKSFLGTTPKLLGRRHQANISCLRRSVNHNADLLELV